MAASEEFLQFVYLLISKFNTSLSLSLSLTHSHTHTLTHSLTHLFIYYFIASLIANVQVIQTIQLLADGIGRRSATGPLSSFLIVSRSHVENSLELALQRLLATAPDLYIARFYTNDTSEPNDLL